MSQLQHMLSRTTAMGLLTLVGLVGTAQAQDATPAAQLPAIVVNGAQQSQAAGGAGDNTTTVNIAGQQQNGASRKLDDTLREVPGVFTRVNAGQPGVAVNIRGFEGSGRVSTSVDGVKQDFRFTGHEAAGYVFVDPNLLAGVDITRGADLDAGGGGLAGSVNFRTIEADDVVQEGKSSGSLMRLSYGDNGTDYSEMLATARKGADFDIVGAISKRDSKSYSNGDGDIVNNSGQDLKSGLLKVTWHIDPQQSLELGALLYSNDFYANSYFQTVDSNIYTAKYHYDAGDGLIDLRANVHFSDLKMHYTGATSSMAKDVGRVVEDKGYGADVSNVSTFDFESSSLRSTNGFEVFRDDVSSTKGGVNPTDGKLTTGALFTDNVWTLGRTQLSAGARIDTYKLEGTAQTGTETDQIDNSHTSFDPKLTAAYTLFDGIQPYVTWSRTMRAPTAQETMLGGVHPGGTVSSMLPNPDLKAETSRGWEVGVNFDRPDVIFGGDRLHGRISAYRMNVGDYIVAQASPTTGGYSFVNVDGTSKTNGVEISANYDINRYTFGLGYTKTNSDLPSQMPGLGASQYLPDETVTVSAAARFLSDALTVGGTFDHVSSGKVAGFNAYYTGGEASNGGDDYNLVGLFATYKVSENFDVNMRVTNLFNEQYTPFLSTSGDGQGRTVYVGAQVRF